ncbi:uncharacterized protein LOC123532511 [Mercenaria mercenaria]|uniref:uncharacterized protein LOC123532511 n=1 Tax=Mercenaria mercenaria TaxID=6596 RepID=UPI001E1D470C|nr:uncharacterized protein LOC123532511 [Mercenaria mercenaria]
MFHFLKRHKDEKMPTHSDPGSPLTKPLSAIAVPGMYLFYKYSEFKRQQQEVHRKKVTEKELDHLNHKIDKLLAKIDDKDTEQTVTSPTKTPVKSTVTTEDEECVICMSAKATMQTFPCGHKVICRKCFIKTIQVAVSQRCLPLKCVICRTRILKLRQSSTVKMPSAKIQRSKTPSAYSRFTKQSKVYAK